MPKNTKRSHLNRVKSNTTNSKTSSGAAVVGPDTPCAAPTVVQEAVVEREPISVLSLMEEIPLLDPDTLTYHYKPDLNADAKAKAFEVARQLSVIRGLVTTSKAPGAIAAAEERARDFTLHLKKFQASSFTLACWLSAFIPREELSDTPFITLFSARHDFVAKGPYNPKPIVELPTAYWAGYSDETMELHDAGEVSDAFDAVNLMTGIKTPKLDAPLKNWNSINNLKAMGVLPVWEWMNRLRELEEEGARWIAVFRKNQSDHSVSIDIVRSPQDMKSYKAFCEKLNSSNASNASNSSVSRSTVPAGGEMVPKQKSRNAAPESDAESESESEFEVEVLKSESDEEGFRRVKNTRKKEVRLVPKKTLAPAPTPAPAPIPAPRPPLQVPTQVHPTISPVSAPHPQPVPTSLPLPTPTSTSTLQTSAADTMQQAAMQMLKTAQELMERATAMMSSVATMHQIPQTIPQPPPPPPALPVLFPAPPSPAPGTTAFQVPTKPPQVRPVAPPVAKPAAVRPAMPSQPRVKLTWTSAPKPKVVPLTKVLKEEEEREAQRPKPVPHTIPSPIPAPAPAPASAPRAPSTDPICLTEVKTLKTKYVIRSRASSSAASSPYSLAPRPSSPEEIIGLRPTPPPMPLLMKRAAPAPAPVVKPLVLDAFVDWGSFQDNMERREADLSLPETTSEYPDDDIPAEHDTESVVSEYDFDEETVHEDNSGY